MDHRRFKFIFGALPLLVLACGGGQVPPSANAQGNRANTTVTNQQTPGSAMTIKQGTVGKVGKYSVGVKNIIDSSAQIAVWDAAMPQTDRNDFNVSYSVKAGDSIPIGDKFYKVANVGPDEIQIDSETTKAEDIKLPENSLAIPNGGVLELHGSALEVVSIAQNSANFEIYSNDVPKKDAEAKNGIRRSTVSTGDEISIGNAKHKVTAIHAANGARRGFVEVSAK